MHDLIIATLQEGRIHRAERFHTPCRETGTEGHPMLLGNRYVKATARVAFCKEVQPRAIGHRRRHRDDLVVLCGHLGQGLAKDARITWCVAWRLLLFASRHVKLRRRMTFVPRCLSRPITLALLRHNMQQHRPSRPFLHRAQHRQKLLHIVPVNRPQIGKAQRFKERPANRHALEHILGALSPLAEGFRQQRHRPLGRRFQFLKRLTRIEAAQVRRHRPHRRRNRHVVVIEDHKQALAQMARIVHRLIGHARRNRAIANHRNRIAQTAFTLTAQIPRDGKTQSR